VANEPVGGSVRNFEHGTLTLRDGSPTPVTLTLAFERGDFAFSGLSAALNETAKVERRGQFVTAVHGARVYPTVSWSAWLADLTVASAPSSALDFLLRSGAYASNTSTLGSGRPYAIDIIWDIEGTDLGASADDQVVWNDCLPILEGTEAADGNTISCSCEVLGAITGSIDVAQIS
jgi:hypothetical protein